ncbi:MAG: hypothetical protein A3F91_11415 [Flavobacteria bacterium RIFCSPLOWO2_12_FULL_35_11]|nr:MAG: hypothetical protein A3F91_11415 [Flavobacteria bacterium RIFCSPLOWO2_12_FULL_35_11]
MILDYWINDVFFSNEVSTKLNAKVIILNDLYHFTQSNKLFIFCFNFEQILNKLVFARIELCSVI